MDSVLNQTVRDIEIIMVDDGSPDNCPALCDEYAKSDQRIKVIHKHNEGLGLARNSGLKVATGEYVAFIDSDDYIDVHMLEDLYNVAHKKQLQAVYCGIIHENNGHKVYLHEVDNYTEFTDNASCRQLGLRMIAPTSKNGKGLMTSVWHAIFKREFLIEKGISFCSEREFISEDMIFDIDFFAVANKVAFVPQAYYYYCYNSSSLSNSFKTNTFLRQKEHYHEMLRRLQALNYHPEDLNVAHWYIIDKARGIIFRMALFNVPSQERKKILAQIFEDSDLIDKLKNSTVRAILPLKRKIFYYAIVFKLPWIFYLFNFATINKIR